jgi:hypothetical protein
MKDEKGLKKREEEEEEGMDRKGRRWRARKGAGIEEEEGENEKGRMQENSKERWCVP